MQRVALWQKISKQAMLAKNIGARQPKIRAKSNH
jgi:hypothetical protein